MDESLARIIRQALEDAQAKGRDYLTQTELAVRAVLIARPDMTASEVLTMVELVRREIGRASMKLVPDLAETFLPGTD